MWWLRVMLEVPLWTAQAHLPERSVIDELREEEPNGYVFDMPNARAPKQKKKQKVASGP